MRCRRWMVVLVRVARTKANASDRSPAFCLGSERVCSLWTGVCPSELNCLLARHLARAQLARDTFGRCSRLTCCASRRQQQQIGGGAELLECGLEPQPPLDLRRPPTSLANLAVRSLGKEAVSNPNERVSCSTSSTESRAESAGCERSPISHRSFAGSSRRRAELIRRRLDGATNLSRQTKIAALADSGSRPVPARGTTTTKANEINWDGAQNGERSHGTTTTCAWHWSALESWSLAPRARPAHRSLARSPPAHFRHWTRSVNLAFGRAFAGRGSSSD